LLQAVSTAATSYSHVALIISSQAAQKFDDDLPLQGIFFVHSAANHPIGLDSAARYLVQL
jgi:hypothetical protein